MSMEKTKRQTLVSWFSLGILAALCGILAMLQYRWIGEVSRSERDKLQGDLQTSLYRLSREFNTEINGAAWALMPADEEIGRAGRDAAYAARYEQWKTRHRHNRLFRHIALAAPKGGLLLLRNLDLATGAFRASEWPVQWTGVREQILMRREGRPPGPFTQDEVSLFELPRFGNPAKDRSSRDTSEQEWLILDLDLDYVRRALLPELIQRHLTTNGKLDYHVEVVVKASPFNLIYPPDLPQSQRIGGQSDASVTLFEIFYSPDSRSTALAGGRTEEQSRGPGAGLVDSGRGRWQLLARRSGNTLDAVVSRARRLNLAVSAAILLLMLATAALLIRFTRRAQALAELEMNFVAGVSHEFRTPLTVIGTAAYNLRGRVAQNPSQVERYGELIQKEAQKLTALVEQVLKFAGAKAGHIIRQREQLSVESLIEESLQSSKAVLDEARCVVEKHIEPGLPSVFGDPVALKQVIENLLQNAAKYGADGERWIGVSASSAANREGSLLEIRVSDRGPGIPAEEQAQIFEPFFRGSRAVRNQIHGTGLGLNLVKRIVEAHRGTITVRSEPLKGAEFIVRIPLAEDGISA